MAEVERIERPERCPTCGATTREWPVSGREWREGEGWVEWTVIGWECTNVECEEHEPVAQAPVTQRNEQRGSG
jgi:hypothetical protein